METPEKPDRKPCPLGLTAAQAAQDAVAPDIVILFGSRARGDHRPESDIDLLVIHQEQRAAAVAIASRAGYAELKAKSLDTPVNAIGITRRQFDYARRSPNHVTAQALRDGVVMTGENLSYTPDWDDEYPASWPDVKERIQAAYRNLTAFNYLIANPDIDQEIYGFNAQQAVENALKGWISAADLRYTNTHSIDQLAAILLQDRVESATAAADQLRYLLDYATHRQVEISGDPETWLTRYAVEYRYSGAQYQMDELEKARFQDQINQIVPAAIQRAHELTGTNSNDLP